MKDSGYKSRSFLLVVSCVLALAALVWLAVDRLEGRRPELRIDLDQPFIGRSKTIHLKASDAQSGLRQVWVAIMQNGREQSLLDDRFQARGLLRKGTRRHAAGELHIEPAQIGMTDGEAVLRVMAVDFSWKNWGKGNRTYLEQKVLIDTRPPTIGVVSRAHNINPGGAGLVVYRLSEPCPRSGVRVGEQLYPGFILENAEPETYLAFFALGHDQPSDVEMHLEAVDRAGNTAQSGFPHYIRQKRFKRDTLRLSDRFLKWKMPEFESQIPQSDAGSLLDQFLYVNRTIRMQNKAAIDRVTRNSQEQIAWQGSFLRLPAAAPRAGFADQRQYVYKGQAVDRQVHLGVDLASLRQSPVPAANAGRVVNADRIGIYGNTLVLDHGCGLFSMYAHLSRFSVSEGQDVSKGDIIGYTGTSGLAGGDHLHFSMLVHQTFVDPIEWWDANWIRNNISGKLEGLVQ